MPRGTLFPCGTLCQSIIRIYFLPNSYRTLISTFTCSFYTPPKKEAYKMNHLWTYIDHKNWHEETKYRIALLLLGILFALIGFAIWLVIRIWILSSWDWMLCFIGYPIVISWLVVFFYSCRHGFHDRKPVN